jgi:hypothetical protein
MKLHINANQALTVVKGQAVYELPIHGDAALNIMAIYADEGAAQDAVRRLLNAVTASCKVGNRHELESVDSPIMRVHSDKYRISNGAR